MEPVKIQKILIITKKAMDLQFRELKTKRMIKKRKRKTKMKKRKRKRKMKRT